MKLSLTMIALLLAGAGLSAQTTGFPFFNDYTINGSVSGSTSCTNVTIVLPSLLSFDVQTAGPGRTVWILAHLTSPCTPNSLGGFFCQGTTFDLNPIGVNINPVPITNAAGLTNLTLFAPAFLAPLDFSTQALIFEPGCPAPLFTQAYDVNLI